LSLSRRMLLGLGIAVAGTLLGRSGEAKPNSITATESTIDGSPDTTSGERSVLVRYKFQTVNGSKIFYRVAGDASNPAILLLHGFPSSSRMFDRLMTLLANRFYLIAPDYLGFGHSDAPSSETFKYTFDNIAESISAFTELVGLKKFALFMQDYGAPVGMRIATAHPDRVTSLIIQNGNLYEQGLGPAWEARRAFWNDRKAHEPALKENFLSLAATRSRHIGHDPDIEKYDPDLWTDEFAFLSRGGQSEIQCELFYDYQNNVRLYPSWQAWLREHQPRTLVVWGRYDASFTESGATLIKKDVPGAAVHLLDGSHFVMDTCLRQVSDLVRKFLS